jgi:hypothetical protein
VTVSVPLPLPSAMAFLLPTTIFNECDRVYTCSVCKLVYLTDPDFFSRRARTNLMGKAQQAKSTITKGGTVLLLLKFWRTLFVLYLD